MRPITMTPGTAPLFDKSNTRLLLGLLALLILGLFLRLGAIGGSQVLSPIRSDAKEYFFYALNLKESATYSLSVPAPYTGVVPVPDAKRPPGYPVFMAALLSDDWRRLDEASAIASIRPVLYGQALLSTLCILLVFLLGRLTLGNAAGLAAAALTAISPHLVNMNIYLLSEPLFTFYFLAALVFLLHGMREASARPLVEFVLAGLLLAAATLTRPTTQYLPYLLALAGAGLAPSRWRWWLGLVASYQLAVLAWTLRNLAVTGASGDPTLLVGAIQAGSYPGMMYNHDPASLGIPYKFDPVLTDFSSLAKALPVLLERAAAAPGEYLHWYAIGKLLAFFHWSSIPVGTVEAAPLLVSGDIYVYPTLASPYAGSLLHVATYLGAKLLHYPLVLLALAGTLLAWLPRPAARLGLQDPALRLLALCLAYVVGLHVIGFPIPRYAQPFLPLVYLLALALATQAWQRFRPAAAVEAPPPLL
jgi:4-amino-4-deoxy-L-arabinose transferase-like glycosyltransferase